MKILRLISSMLLITSFLATFTSCEKWDLKGIKGSGPVVSNAIELSEVEGIILEIPASVYLTQGTEQSIVIEAQQNIIDNIIKTTPNDVLKLKFDKNVAESEPIKVHMNIDKLKEISISGSGEVLSQSKFISDGNLDINVSGSGNVNVNADAFEVKLNIAGSGEIKLITICEEMQANISGSGDIYLDGGVGESVNMGISGSGDIFAYDFLIENCWINMAGSGDARLNVSENLTVNIAGSGDVYYKGNPHLSVSISGSGEVKNAN